MPPIVSRNLRLMLLEISFPQMDPLSINRADILVSTIFDSSVDVYMSIRFFLQDYVTRSQQVLHLPESSRFSSDRGFGGEGNGLVGTGHNPRHI